MITILQQSLRHRQQQQQQKQTTLAPVVMALSNSFIENSANTGNAVSASALMLWCDRCTVTWLTSLLERKRKIINKIHTHTETHTHTLSLSLPRIYALFKSLGFFLSFVLLLLLFPPSKNLQTYQSYFGHSADAARAGPKTPSLSSAGNTATVPTRAGDSSIAFKTEIQQTKTR